MLALAGWHFHETSGAAILRAAGLDDWVALDPEDYVRQAVARIGDRPALEALRRQLPDRLADGGLVGGRGHGAAPDRGAGGDLARILRNRLT